MFTEQPILHNFAGQVPTYCGAALLGAAAWVLLSDPQHVSAAVVVAVIGVGTLLLAALIHLRSIARNVNYAVRTLEQLVAADPEHLTRGDVDAFRRAIGLPARSVG